MLLEELLNVELAFVEANSKLRASEYCFCYDTLLLLLGGMAAEAVYCWCVAAAAAEALSCVVPVTLRTRYLPDTAPPPEDITTTGCTTLSWMARNCASSSRSESFSRRTS